MRRRVDARCASVDECVCVHACRRKIYHNINIQPHRADIVLNFRTGYWHHGKTIYDYKKIAKHYVKVAYVFDSILAGVIIVCQSYVRRAKANKKTINM